jgi:hypothetical protein
MSACPIPSRTRRRLAMQGFGDLDDAALAEIQPWLRLAPGICSVVAFAGTLLAIPLALWTLMLIGLLCAIRGAHLFDLLYTLVFRRLLGTPLLPRYGTPRRFACLIAAVCLGVAGGAFVVGAPLLGYTLGTVLALATGIAAITDFCLGCYFHLLLVRFSAR